MCETYQHREDYLEFMRNRCTTSSVIIYKASKNRQNQPEIFESSSILEITQLLDHLRNSLEVSKVRKEKHQRS